MIRRWVRGEAGSALIEFAILAPTMFFLLAGVVEISRYAYLGILAAHAARAGVQYGAQTLITAQDNVGIQNAAIADAQNLTQWHVAPAITCTLNGAATTCPSNSANALSPGLVYYVQVQVTGTFTSLLNYPGIPNSVPVRATAVMRLGSQ